MKYWKVTNGSDMTQFDDDIGNVCQEFCRNVEESVRRVEAANARLQTENEVLKDEHYENKKIQELENEIAKYRSLLGMSFKVDEDKWKAIHTWQKRHLLEHHGYDGSKPYGGAIGGSWTYEFVPTSIGTAGSCICDVCRRAGKDKSIYRFEFRELG